MKKKLWMTFGPLLIAGAVFLFILFGPSSIFGGVTQGTIKKSATSMSTTVVQGVAIQQKMLAADKTYLPIFGSSELSRVDQFHPNVFSEKYNRGYTPFLIGRPGTQSLSHYLDIKAMGNELKGKKVVFILSPQWFQPAGVDDGHFGGNFSPLQAYKFALSDDAPTPERRYAARRLLSYKVVKNNSTLSTLLENIASPGSKTEVDAFTKVAAAAEMKILQRKDDLESKFIKGSREEKVANNLKLLPDKLDYAKLDELATKTGESKVGANPFFIKDSYYQKKLAPTINQLKDSRTNLSYDKSPEYSDLQLVMDAFKEAGADVLFINPPVNGPWYDYIGASREKLQKYYDKSGKQVKDQGFQYVDMSRYSDTPYFLEDTIHLSWRGWVVIDKQIDQFMHNKTKPNYEKTPKQFYFNQLLPPKKEDNK
ncbi:D-alanyl-lipoteichoic acid biosynthesis protein DltD [Listeria grandensis]|uniref:D-alanyl-lipoteichoic acid biosynthesis protein DltD n=1 Tax=Listeria grandensis TaxID=1494963 RepID=UPI001629FF41|nr:D-alanyl-lipoteichoic acid biosynthesis protein DltD [Listeria grandensis]MBC1474245.1 D-alanyl-lipoteichoic acid biosynthesis protein DltD [Listeria grandensis]